MCAGCGGRRGRTWACGCVGSCPSTHTRWAAWRRSAPCACQALLVPHAGDGLQQLRTQRGRAASLPPLSPRAPAPRARPCSRCGSPIAPAAHRVALAAAEVLAARTNVKLPLFGVHALALELVAPQRLPLAGRGGRVHCLRRRQPWLYGRAWAWRRRRGPHQHFPRLPQLAGLLSCSRAQARRGEQQGRRRRRCACPAPRAAPSAHGPATRERAPRGVLNNRPAPAPDLGKTWGGAPASPTTNDAALVQRLSEPVFQHTNGH